MPDEYAKQKAAENAATNGYRPCQWQAERTRRGAVEADIAMAHSAHLEQGPAVNPDVLC
jgi:hypothetical protein